jgi:outer membrane protein assembly factor BamB
MRATRSGLVLVDPTCLSQYVVLVLLIGLLAGCGTASTFNAAAPLSSDVTIAYSVGASGSTTTAGLIAFKGRDGTDAWHTATGEPSTQFKPLLVNGVIYTEGGSRQAAKGALVAVRAADGHTLWQVPMPDREFSIASDGTIVLVAASGGLGTAKVGGVYALDATTGALRWHLDEPATAPVYVGDGLAIASLADPQRPQGRLAIYQEDDGTPLWQLPYVPNVVGINHTAVYTSDGNVNEVLAYAARTGKELWHQEIAGNIVGVSDQTVTLGSAQNAACLDATTGSLIWNVDVSLDVWPGIVQTSTALYATHQDQIVALNTATGDQLWQTEFRGFTILQITQQQGMVFALIAGGSEFSKSTRIVAVDGSHGTVYWARDIQEVLFLVNS